MAAAYNSEDNSTFGYLSAMYSIEETSQKQVNIVLIIIDLMLITYFKIKHHHSILN